MHRSGWLDSEDRCECIEVAGSTVKTGVNA